jgi:medium-chain acyl-[acyl-carrier-protein] hydrolase
MMTQPATITEMAMLPLAATWFAPQQPNPQASLRMFCFPYAGGTSSIFNGWPRQLPSCVEVCPVHLAGRESRFRERPFTRVVPLVESMAQAILPLLDKPFAFFGHSMGALLGFELIRYLQKEHRPTPFCFFASGRSAPQLQLKVPLHHRLPEPQLIEELRRMNATPKEVLEHAELMRLVIPSIRADFELCETYSYLHQPPLNSAITAFGGGRDRHVKPHHLEGWRQQTSSFFSHYIFPGDHFFLHSSEGQVLDRLGRELSRFKDELA